MTGAGAAQGAHVVVVGGGITGLAAAHSLAQLRPAPRLTLLEARPALGGNIITEHQDGFLLDAGPDAFVRTKPPAVQLVKQLGLEHELITPSSRNVYLVHHGKLELMPAGLALAIPTRILPMVRSPLLSFSGKLRVLADLWLPTRAPHGPDTDASIDQFLVRRFGREAAERLVGPLLGGIYAGDTSNLSMRATFPQLLRLQEQHGSVIRGLLAAQRARRKALGAKECGSAASPFYSLRGGLGTLVAALAQTLPSQAVRTQAPVSRVEPCSQGRWRVVLEGGECLPADAVILTVPAHVAGALVADSELAAELKAIPYVTTATVFVALRREDIDHSLDGVGFIVPRGEARLMAATWVSSKWSQRAPPGGVLLRAFIGGAHVDVPVAELADAELVHLTVAELQRLLGRMETPRFTRVFRYVDANPQPVVGHDARLRRIRQRLAQSPGLELAGAAYEGVGIADCVAQAQAAAARVLRKLDPAT